VFSYILRRLGQSVIVLLIVIVLTFSLPYFQPHGIFAPAYAVLGARSTPYNVHVWASQHGLLQPYWTRLYQYIFQLVVHFNLGYSFKQNLSVRTIIALYVPRTVWLALSALIFTVVIAVPLGIFQASRRNTAVDYAATGTAFVLYAIPAFLLCLLVIEVAGFNTLHLPISPPEGVAPWAIFTDPKSFILPVGCLTLLSVASISRFMRGTVLEVLVQDYVRTARAKGCSPFRVLWHHSFRNALGPIVTILGLSIPALFGGALIVEYVFNYAGLGLQTLNAALDFDVPTVLGITILVSIFTLLGNLAADVALGIIDPRLRIQGASK
jgi:peptide/nickel transport system permease protein